MVECGRKIRNDKQAKKVVGGGHKLSIQGQSNKHSNMCYMGIFGQSSALQSTNMQRLILIVYIIGSAHIEAWIQKKYCVPNSKNNAVKFKLTYHSISPLSDRYLQRPGDRLRRRPASGGHAFSTTLSRLQFLLFPGPTIWINL